MQIIKLIGQLALVWVVIAVGGMGLVKLNHYITTDVWALDVAIILYAAYLAKIGYNKLTD